MGLRVTAALTGLVGGIAWIALLLLNDGSLADALTWVGLVLLGIATLGAGASLVSRSAVWLQVVVAVCFAALVASVLSLLTDHYDDQVVHAGFGVLAVIAAVVALTRPGRPRAVGTHAR